MCRLNYNDLIALIVEYEITKLEQYFKQLEKNRQSELGYDVVEASNDDIIKQHGKKGGEH